MPKAYADDLRVRIVRAVDAGASRRFVMDNRPAHKVKGIDDAIATRDAELRYLPR
ncbi:hypothetical protein [uncultured Sphingomonas sp.]|uniref:hypothetical protein n=1 Tax=uncultured Sphingomonas sp. TaxID=158754 RepID=UPI0035CBA62F